MNDITTRTDPAALAYEEHVAAEAALNNFEGDEESEEGKALAEAHLRCLKVFVAAPVTSPAGALGKVKYLMDTAAHSDIDADPKSVTGLALATLHDYLLGIEHGGFSRPATRRRLIDGSDIETIGLKIKNAAGAAFLVGESCGHDGDAANAAFLISTVLYEARDQLYDVVFGPDKAVKDTD